MKFSTSIFYIFLLVISGKVIAQKINSSGTYKQNREFRVNTNPSIIQNDTSICFGSSISLALNISQSIPSTILSPGSQFEYSFITPSIDWTTSVGGWATGNAPFGNNPDGDFGYNTDWPSDTIDGYDLYVRKNIDLTGYDLSTIHWYMGVDNGYVLYVNGDLLGSDNVEGYTFRWEYDGILPKPLLHQGNNVIAVALEDHGGLTAFDMMIEGAPLARSVSILWSTGETTPAINITPNQTATYYVTVSDGFTTTKDSVTVTVLQKPAVNFDHDAYCSGRLTNFVNKTDTSKSGTVNYLWNFGDGTTSTAVNPHHIYESPGSYKVTLSVNPKTCINLANELSKTIEILSRPEAVRYPTINIGANEAVQLQARPGVSYDWIPSLGLNNSGIQNPKAFLSVNQEYLIRIKNSDDCIVTDTLFVKVTQKEPAIYIPTAFTPNHDGKNDELRPLLTGVKKINYFRVYNRMGKLVYQSKEFNKGWSGTYNGTEQPTGVYVWLIEIESFNGMIIQQKGTVLLIK